MTTSERDSQKETGAHPRIPHQNRRGDGSGHNTERKPVVLHGRPRTVEGEEAYLRSMMEQAATDIAAGW
jgi:hypothetical protein